MRKYASSDFVGAPLDQVLRAHRIDTVLLTGIVTWGCVMATAQSAGKLGYLPVVVSDCVAGNVPYLHEAALVMMARSFDQKLVKPAAQVLRQFC